ncbi:MAG: hypothetical protein WC527_07810 [Candidatus Margulisiibacteriota bacterium]
MKTSLFGFLKSSGETALRSVVIKQSAALCPGKERVGIGLTASMSHTLLVDRFKVHVFRKLPDTTYVGPDYDHLFPLEPYSCHAIRKPGDILGTFDVVAPNGWRPDTVSILNGAYLEVDSANNRWLMKALFPEMDGDSHGTVLLPPISVDYSTFFTERTDSEKALRAQYDTSNYEAMRARFPIFRPYR